MRRSRVILKKTTIAFCGEFPLSLRMEICGDQVFGKRGGSRFGIRLRQLSAGDDGFLVLIPPDKEIPNLVSRLSGVRSVWVVLDHRLERLNSQGVVAAFGVALSHVHADFILGRLR